MICVLIFQEIDDRMTEMYIKETCEAAIIVTFHPATAICINIQEMEDSGGVWIYFIQICIIKI